MKEIFIVMMRCGSKDLPMIAFLTKKEAKTTIKRYENYDFKMVDLKPDKDCHYYIKKITLFENY